MDADVDSAWICTQAIVSTDSQSDDEKEKINNYGYIVLNDMIDNEHYILKEGDNTIGRHPLNHIYIEHPSVSMNHAVIQCDSDGVVLLDKGSLNKTKLNKKILRKDVAYFLEENSLLMFGEVQADYFINEKSIELKNDTKSMAPANTFVHKAAQNDGLSLSKLSNTVITPKSFRTDIPNAISDCNVSLVIENKTTCKIEKEVPKTITGTECAMNTLNDIHPNINSSSPSDEYLLEALRQVETKQNNVNSNKIVQNLSNEDTLIMNLTESVSEITREDTLSPVMDLKSSILTTHNVTKNQFQSPNKINTEAMREDTPSPVMDLKSSILTTNNIPTIIFQSPSKINKELIREDTPSPIMDFGCCNDFENNLETNNYGIISSIQSPNEVDKFNNTQVLEIDSNIVELYTHTSNNNEVQNVESGKQSIIPIKNCLDNLSGSNNINLSTNGNNTDKHKIIVNTFEADDDDVFRHFIEEECKSQQHDLTILENQDFFNCPTQKVSIKKNIQSKVTSSIHKKESQNLIDHSKSIKNNASASKIIHDDLTQITEMDDDFFNCPTQKVSTSKKVQLKDDEETQELLEFSKPCKSNSIVSKSYSTSIHEENTQNPKVDDDFFNCPTQKLSTSNNIFPNTKVSPSIHEEETQRPPEFSQFIKTKNIASNNYSININKDLTEVPKTEDDFFNCPTQKVLITKKVNPKPKVSSSINDEETQELLEFSKPCKSNSIVSKSYSTSIHEENTQNPKIDDDFFNCPTQKLSISKKIFPKPKISHSIHEEETQRPLEFSEFVKTNNITSNNYSTNMSKDLTEVPEMDDDFFNCPTQKVSITKKQNPKPKISSSINDEETQELLEFSKPCKSNSIVSKSYSTSIHEENTQNPIIDDDFFNCPTQKLSTSKNIFPKPKVSHSIHEEETQRSPEFSEFDKTNNIASNNYSTNINKDLTEVPDVDDDFFNCPTQKVLTSKKVRPKVISSIHDEETQELLEFSKPCKSNSIVSKSYSTSMHEENTQNSKIDDDFFDCPTQKLSTSRKINSKPKVFSSIHDEETQRPPEFSQFNKTNTITSKPNSISIHKENTQNPKMDDDFFNCPTQKLSISKKIFPKPKVSHSIHEEETQRPPEFSQFDKTNNIASNNYSINVNKDLTEVPEMDDDFFNCPTQKISITKKQNPKPKISSSINDEETQELLEFSKPCKSNSIVSKSYSTSIHEENTQNPKIDDDFFNCPTQKLSTSKNIFSNTKVSHSIHEEETQRPPEFSQFDKTNNIASNNYSTNRHVDLTEVSEIDDDFFNCPTQKLLITKKLNPKPTVSSSIHEEETQRPPEFSQFDKTNNITSNTYSTSIHGDLKNVLKIDDEDFFNCPTQKVPCDSNSKFSKDCKKHELIPIFNNEAETKNLSIQSISKTISPINIKQNKGNIFNFTSQKVLTKVQSKSISNCSININEDVTKNPEQFDGSNSHKETVIPDNEDRCKVQKSKFVKSNIISPSNVQLPVMCNENSSNSLRTNKPNIRVREDLHYMSYSGGSSNDSTVILNKPNKNSVFNNINTTVPFNKNFDSPGCSKTTTFKKNDINASSSTKQECFNDNSDQSQVSISLKYNSYLKQMNESIFSPLNIPDVSANSLLEDHSSPTTIENNLNTLKCEPSTSSNDTFKWKSFWNKKKVQSQNRGKSDKQKSIKIEPEVKENKERYQTRAITRKRKLNGIVESNKKLCNRNNILEPLVGNSSEIVVSFSYLKSRHLQEMKQFVEKTGGTVTDEITQCTVLVTDKIRCTMKILSAIAKGCPIVNANWLKHSYTVKMFQDVDDFIIADKDAERKYKFQLKESLAKARTKRLLDGYNVLVTPSVKPGPQEMKVIITCAGGNFVLNWTTTQYTKELIVTCDKDRNRWKPAWDNDLAKIIDSDTLVMSIIRQQLTI